MARDLTDVARDAGLPPRDVEQVGEFLFHDEAGLALEELCCALRDEDAAVAPGDLSLIALEGMRALCDPDLWENLPVRPGPQSAPAAPGGFSRVVACPVWGLAELEVLPSRMWTGPCRYALLAGEGLRLDVVLRSVLYDGPACRSLRDHVKQAAGSPAVEKAPSQPASTGSEYQCFRCGSSHRHRRAAAAISARKRGDGSACRHANTSVGCTVTFKLMLRKVRQ